MSREVKRVPLDFDWPLSEPWQGYLMPALLREKDCPDCKSGYSPYAQHLQDQWYGNAPFDPRSTGSTPLTSDTPAVRACAERNVADSPGYYGAGEGAVRQEAQRLAQHWNRCWCHHLTQGDVDVLAAAGRLREFTTAWNPTTRRWQEIEPPVTPTAAQVNEWSLTGMGHDAINSAIVVLARCESDAEPGRCGTCGGRATLEKYPGQRAEADAWEYTEPPSGPGWQLWETVTDGSPITPVFADPEGLARYMTVHGWGATNPMVSSFETAMRFLDAGWAPLGVAVDVDGVEFTGRADQ